MCVARKLNSPEALPKTVHFHVHRLPDLRSALLGVTVSTMYFALLMGILLSTLVQAGKVIAPAIFRWAQGD